MTSIEAAESAAERQRVTVKCSETRDCTGPESTDDGRQASARSPTRAEIVHVGRARPCCATLARRCRSAPVIERQKLGVNDE